MIVTSQLIVLAKSPYRENSLLLNGVSPDMGRQSVLLHGGARNAAGAAPAADLYRELEIKFNDEIKSTLYTALECEVIGVFDALADDTRAFLMAGKIGAFLLGNMQPGIAHPMTYDTLRSVFVQLSGAGEGEKWTLEECAVAVKAAFLYENGMLPEGTTPEQQEFLENLIAAGIDGSELPACDPGYWHKLNVWLNALIEYNHLSRG